MTFYQLERKVIKIIAEHLDVDESIVHANASFDDDLGADSLDNVELIMAFEEEFDIEIPDEVAERGKTYGKLFVEFIKAFPRQVWKMIETKVICFRFNENGKIEAVLKVEDGSWCYADGTRILPSSICLLTFSKWANALKELEEIINSPNTKERDLQIYFENYPELLAGNDYDVVLPQAVIVSDENSVWKSDFVLTPKNQYEFSKIVELKIPNIPITKRPQSGHVSFSAKLWNAIQQVKDYSKAFDSDNSRKLFKSNYGVDIFRPDLHLIAGRKWDILLMDSIKTLQKDSNVKIEDWDTVLDRLKRNYT